VGEQAAVAVCDPAFGGADTAAAVEDTTTISTLLTRLERKMVQE